MMKWIDVKKQLPKEYQRVLASDGEGYDFLYLTNEFNFLDQPTGVKFWCPCYQNIRLGVNPEKITHWMEIELPKKEKKIGR